MIDPENDLGMRCLHYVVAKGHSIILDALIYLKVEINAPVKPLIIGGRKIKMIPAIVFAFRNENLEIVLKLIENGSKFIRLPEMEDMC